MDYSVEPEPEQPDDDAENMMKMLELSERFVPGKGGEDLDIMDNPLERKYVREGTLKKNGNDRKIFLFTDILVLTKETVKKGESRYEVRRVMPLVSAKLWTQRHHVKSKQRLGFEVTLLEPGGARYTADFMAKDQEDRDSWIRDLKTQMMGQLELLETRGEESPHGPESLCVYGNHHRLLGGTLAHAALVGDVETVRRVRDEAPDDFGSLVAERDEFGATVLHIAAFSGDVGVLREILQADSVKPLLRRLATERDRDGLTLACHVARQGHCDVISMIAQASDVIEGLHVIQSTASETPVFDLDYTDASGLAPLEHAVQCQKTDAAVILLEHGTNVDLKGGDGLTGLMRACAAGRISDVRRWLELGASVDEVCDAGRTALHHAACGTTMQRQCVEALLGAGAKPNLKCAGGEQTPLAIAEEAGNTSAAESLVERGSHSDDAKYTRQKEKWMATHIGSEGKELTRRKPPPAEWVQDDASDKCLLCGSEWAMFNRRHHCRSCGTLVCYKCSSHSGPLEIVATVDGPELVDMAAQKEERLCDACFNYHSLHEYEEPPVATPPVLRASSSGGGFGGSPNSSLEPPAVVQTSQDLPSDREQLMDGARGQSLPAEGSALSAAGAASEARDQVLANIEKAKVLEDKTREMAENASEFASLARKIREKNERANSFW